MLMNLIDVDFAAQKISIKSSTGAILLFDFRAAFPSMDHDLFGILLKRLAYPYKSLEQFSLHTRTINIL